MKAVLLTAGEARRLAIPDDRPSPRIVLTMRGGLPTGYAANGDGIELTVIDYDESFDLVTQPDGSMKPAGVYRPKAMIRPTWVNSNVLVD